MAEPKSYQVQCPDCRQVFTVSKTAEQIADSEDLTECPNCYGEFESDYYQDTDTLELIGPDDDDEEHDLLIDDEGDDEDDDEEEYDD